MAWYTCILQRINLDEITILSVNISNLSNKQLPPPPAEIVDILCNIKFRNREVSEWKLQCDTTVKARHFPLHLIILSEVLIPQSMFSAGNLCMMNDVEDFWNITWSWFMSHSSCCEMCQSIVETLLWRTTKRLFETEGNKIEYSSSQMGTFVTRVNSSFIVTATLITRVCFKI